MIPSRREFLQNTLSVGVTAGAAMQAAAAAQEHGPSGPEPRKLGLLILGGTGFLGPAVVEAALARGYEMTLFNRGRTNPDLFEGRVETLRGDRDPDKGEGLSGLRGRRWDAVIDTSGYFPRLVGASAGLLADAVGQYVFISSISVYSDNSIIGMDESGPIATMEDETLEEFGPQFEYYGPLKALCEQAAEQALPGRATTIRPGLIVGPRDPTPRFTYWPVRVRRGGDVLSPGSPNDPVQYIDVRDLADFIIQTIRQRDTGVFNATGPNAPTDIAQMLYGCKAVTGGSAEFTWVDADFLADRQINGWSDLPVWVAPRDGHEGFHRVSIARAIAAGLKSRPLAETASATLAWYDTLPADRAPKFSLTPEREAEVLAAWKAR